MTHSNSLYSHPMRPVNPSYVFFPLSAFLPVLYTLRSRTLSASGVSLFTKFCSVRCGKGVTIIPQRRESEASTKARLQVSCFSSLGDNTHVPMIDLLTHLNFLPMSLTITRKYRIYALRMCPLLRSDEVQVSHTNKVTNKCVQYLTLMKYKSLIQTKSLTNVSSTSL